MTIEPFGKLEFNKSDKVWFGIVDNICPYNTIELSISVDNIDQNLKDKIELVKKLATDYETIVSDLYDLTYEKFKGTKFEVTREEIEKMYFLIAADLKEDNRTWWLVMEPNFDVLTIHNQFLRFTMYDRKVIWANI